MSDKELDHQLLADVNKKKVSVKRELWEWAKAIGIALIIGILIRTLIFEPVRVDGPSMETTLYTNQIMAVSKFIYKFWEPARGDIVVCHFTAEATNYVKRVIGLPGETVEIRAGTVYINGIGIEEPYVAVPAHQDFGPVTVPEGSYLLMGDNRNNSADSRHFSIGPIPKDRLVGRVEAVMWPLNSLQIVRHQ